MIAADLLRRLRNDLPMPVTIAALGRAGPPAKISEGYFRFVCPGCGEMLATVNPRNTSRENKRPAPAGSLTGWTACWPEFIVVVVDIVPLGANDSIFPNDTSLTRAAPPSAGSG